MELIDELQVVLATEFADPRFLIHVMLPAWRKHKDQTDCVFTAELHHVAQMTFLGRVGLEMMHNRRVFHRQFARHLIEAVGTVGGVEGVAQQQVQSAVVAIEGTLQFQALLPIGFAVIVVGDGQIDAIKGTHSRQTSLARVELSVDVDDNTTRGAAFEIGLQHQVRVLGFHTTYPRILDRHVKAVGKNLRIVVILGAGGSKN